jgi:Putative peptidoglycan binding domain/Resolvase, N terminal domain
MKTTIHFTTTRLATTLIGAAVVLSALPAAAHAADTKFTSLVATTPLARGAGYEFQNGSRHVRYLQRQLRRLGERPGPIDGLFGPLTEGSVRRFQRHAGLRVDGLVGPKTATRLGHRISKLHHRALVRERLRHRSHTRPQPATGGRLGGGSTTTTPERAGRNGPTMSLLVALLVALSSAVIVAMLFMTPTRLGRRSRGPAEREEPGSGQAPAATPVIGYVSISDQERLVHGEDYRPQVEAIEAFCRQRGLRLVRIVRDVDATTEHTADASGLQHACQALVGGDVRGLVVQRLGRVTHSPARLAVLLRWLADSGRALIAIENTLDTSTPVGQVVAHSLIEVGDWDHERAVRRRAAKRRKSGRPAVRDLPELHARIAAMRQEGLSLHAIADELNSAGVPTVRGGARWRASSVQAAVGYKRPGARHDDTGLSLPTARDFDDEGER